MPTFRFEAARDNGRMESGDIEADSPRAARAALRTRGLIPVTLESLAATGTAEQKAAGRRLSESELALATRQLASLLAAGLPLDVALATLVEQSENEAQSEIFRAVRGDITSGHRLAEALSRHPRAFTPVYCATVAAGEQAGNFGMVLERLAQYLEDKQALRSKLIAAATYPAIVTVVALAIVLFLMTSVVPQVVQVFDQTRQVLPMPTRILLWLSTFIGSYGIWLALALGAGIYTLRTALRRPGPKYAWDRAILRLPLFGRLMQGVETARFASTLAMLTEAGVPVLRALAAAEATLNNTVMREVVKSAIDKVREGAGIARSLGAAKAFPPVLIRLIETGEATGNLAVMLGHAARNQAREVERRAGAASTLLEPLLILLMGAVVLAIVLAVLLPIIEINQLVR
jgi:general secretion pathway protein F